MRPAPVGLGGAAALAVLVLGAGCQNSSSSNAEHMGDLAVALGHVAVAVHGYVRFGDAPKGLTGQPLILAATKDNPRLLAPFGAYFLTARRDGMLTSVLVCDKERQYAKLEDAGCTASRVDAAPWRESPRMPCTFYLPLAEVCGAP